MPSDTVPNHGMRIGGEAVGTDRGGNRAIPVFNPFTAKSIGSVPKATAAEVRQAIAVAHAYRPRLTRFERAGILNRAAGLVRERSAAIAALISA